MTEMLYFLLKLFSLYSNIDLLLYKHVVILFRKPRFIKYFTTFLFYYFVFTTWSQCFTQLTGQPCRSDALKLPCGRMNVQHYKLTKTFFGLTLWDGGPAHSAQCSRSTQTPGGAASSSWTLRSDSPGSNASVAAETRDAQEKCEQYVTSINHAASRRGRRLRSNNGQL